jgi:flagellin
MWEAGDTTTSDQVAVTSGAQTLNWDVFGIQFTTTSDFIVADNAVCVATAFGVATGLVVSGDNATFQVGESNGANFRISFQIDDMQSAALGTTGKTLNNLTLSSLTNAQSCLEWINTTLDQVSSSRASMGAIQNRLDYTYANIQTSIENVSAAESVIRDVDMAAEMVTFTKTQILLQAGTAMLAQANMAPQVVLQLLG